jgi:predicted hydrocarbon binding protein
LEEATVSFVKGSKISSKLAFVRDSFGQATLDKVIQSLSLADRAELRMVLDTGWYSLELYDRLLKAICNTAAGGRQEIYARIGRHSAELVLQQTYKAFRAKDPAGVIAKMVPLHSLLNDPGEMEVVSDAPNRCRVLVKKPISTEASCTVARAFYQRIVELCGGESVRVIETKCSGRRDRFCQFEISWQTRAHLTTGAPA